MTLPSLLNALKSSRITKRRKHVRTWPILQHEMPLISFIKGDQLIIPGVQDQGATTRACFSFLMKGGGWKGSLFIACSVPQASLRPACRWGTSPCHRAEKANTETITKPNAYPWNRHASSHLRLYFLLPLFFFFFFFTLAPARGWKVRCVKASLQRALSESFSRM